MLPETSPQLNQSGPYYANTIAIVGVSCRFPEASTVQDFWELLRQGKDTVARIRPERWNLWDYYDPSPLAVNKTHQRDASMLQDIHDFDPLFFNISPVEAAEMHPSQKLILELVWEAIESSNIPFRKIQGRHIGVYTGDIWSDFEHYRKQKNVPVTPHSAQGMSANIIANRVSYAYGFTGPSMSVDTGCSSSMTALHLACRSLQHEHVEMAIAAGVNHLMAPDQSVLLSKFGALSEKGRCSAFDSEADGFVRGEGGGVLLLKKLSQAEKDGDRIYALIRGTAINNNGYNVNLPATSIAGQKQVLALAYKQCGIEPHEVHYVEAHGTGTRAGDPVEARALGEFFNTSKRKRKLSIGSVKTNIGHLEGAAGIAGVIKVVLSMQHRLLPANLHYKTPNPDIPFEALQLSVQNQLTPWPVNDRETLKAGVNSFGWGGTNAHAVLEEYRVGDDQRSNLPERSRYCLPLSGRSAAGLREYTKTYVNILKAATESTFKEICIATAILKPAFEYRKLFTANSRDELIGALESFIRDTDEIVPHMPGSNDYKVVMVFPGQGSQWSGMGCGLFLQEQVFRETLEECDRAFMPYSGWSLIQELHASRESNRMQHIDVIQPLLCAIQIALAKLWMSWGIRPEAITGHSMGEVAAAYIAGSLTLDQAACIICTRSSLMKKASGAGSGMIVTELSVEEANILITEKYPALSIAVCNSPKSTILAGDLPAIEELNRELDSRGIFARPVKVDVASHSKQMDPLKPDLEKALEDMKPLPNYIPLFSTARSKMISGEEMDAGYWADNLRNPVQFTAAMEYLLQEGHTVFIEVSPHPVLLNAINECAEAFEAQAIPVATTYREKPEQDSIYRNLGELYERGYDMDWKLFYHTSKAPVVKLPGYPFQRDCFDITYKPKPAGENDILPEESDFLRHFGTLNSVKEKRDLLERLVIQYTAGNIKLSPDRIKPYMTFKGLGQDSLMGIRLKNRLEKKLHIKLPATVFWTHPTITAFVSLLIGILEENPVKDQTVFSAETTEIKQGDPARWFVIPRPQPESINRLFCFHDAGGDASLFNGWERQLGNDFEVVAIELPGRGRRLMEAAASDIHLLIREMMPLLIPLLDKPFLFFGHSLGGLLAFETARALHKAGLPLPRKLFISAMPGPSNYPFREVEYNCSEDRLTSIFTDFGKERIGDEELFQLLIKRLRADLLLFNNYSYTPEMPLPLPLVIIHGKDDERTTGKCIDDWHSETSVSMKVISRPGGHQYIRDDLHFLAALLREETGTPIGDKIIGTWKLISWVYFNDEGQPIHYLGENVTGILMYDKNGNMNAQLTKMERLPFSSVSLNDGSPEDARAALSDYVAYYGKYYENSPGELVHVVEGSLLPNWIGSKQVRYGRLKNDQLILSTPPIPSKDGELVFHLTWRKMLSTHEAH